MKIFKNKLVLGLSFIIALVLITFSYSKIKEYIVLRDVFIFTKENVVSIWRVKKGDNIHDYDYELKSNEIDFLSNMLDSAKLKKADINDSPSNTLGNMTILLDGEARKEYLVSALRTLYRTPPPALTEPRENRESPIYSLPQCYESL